MAVITDTTAAVTDAESQREGTTGQYATNDTQAHDKLTGKVNVGQKERWLSVIAGGVLIAFGLTQEKKGIGTALALGGGYLAVRGVSGQCMGFRALGISTADTAHSPAAVVQHNSGIRVEEVVTIGKPAHELFEFWRNFENLPRFMDHLEAVTVQDSTHSHWTAKGPAGASVAWDAEIINEEPDALIAWKSTEDAQVPNAGSVRFIAAPGNRGTEVRVNLEYAPPAAKLGALVAAMFGQEPRQQVKAELRHFKQLMENGEIPTTEGQTHGKRSRI